MGDEMSKRRKFLFVTWVGPGVSVIKRAKMSTDKAMVKDIISVSIPVNKYTQMIPKISKHDKLLNLINTAVTKRIYEGPRPLN